ncbi:hypothetical protein SOVF_100380 [Spinacia oleracea]|nr:hypothetical protein SOVF_100380 [Spinacia oleracea]
MEQSTATNHCLPEGYNMDEIQQEEDEYELNRHQLQSENEERVEREGGENETPNKCRSPMNIIKEWLPVCEDDLKPKEDLYLTKGVLFITVLALAGGGGAAAADVDVEAVLLVLMLMSHF